MMLFAAILITLLLVTVWTGSWITFGIFILLLPLWFLFLYQKRKEQEGMEALESLLKEVGEATEKDIKSTIPVDK
jgi:hypothetical protein